MTDDLPDEVIRLWPEGAPPKLEGVGPEVPTQLGSSAARQ